MDNFPKKLNTLIAVVKLILEMSSFDTIFRYFYNIVDISTYKYQEYFLDSSHHSRKNSVLQTFLLSVLMYKIENLLK